MKEDYKNKAHKSKSNLRERRRGEQQMDERKKVKNNEKIQKKERNKR